MPAEGEDLVLAVGDCARGVVEVIGYSLGMTLKIRYLLCLQHRVMIRSMITLATNRRTASAIGFYICSDMYDR